jgi:hypothetical protein
MAVGHSGHGPSRSPSRIGKRDPDRAGRGPCCFALVHLASPRGERRRSRRFLRWPSDGSCSQPNTSNLLANLEIHSCEGNFVRSFRAQSSRLAEFGSRGMSFKICRSMIWQLGYLRLDERGMRCSSDLVCSNSRSRTTRRIKIATQHSCRVSAIHTGTRSLSVASSSGARDLLARFEAGHFCSTFDHRPGTFAK